MSLGSCLIIGVALYVVVTIPAFCDREPRAEECQEKRPEVAEQLASRPLTPGETSLAVGAMVLILGVGIYASTR
jgi:hypothetical protein